MAKTKKNMVRQNLPKSATGIQGLDEITKGGLPKGRTSLICGSAGCGKTLLAMEFLVRGATEFDEPGVFMAFEETAKDLAQNVESLGYDLNDLIKRKKMVIDFVYIERSEIEETGEFDLEGLFIRLGQAIDSIGAKRVVLDTIEALFSGFTNSLILRAELRRLFRWLKDRGVTAIITGESGDKSLTRHGLEEYVSDCVIFLDHRVNEQVSSRRLRVVKFRGSSHGTNEYPFLIDEDGISVWPITSLSLKHTVSTKKIPSGIKSLDNMLGGQGFFKGSSVLISGTAGTGKSSLAAHFVEATCKRGEKALYFAFEESPDQIIRNMRSIGIDLKPYLQKGILEYHATRPTFTGLEMHLTLMQKKIKSFKPQIVIVDPINSFVMGSNETEVKAMLMRLVDFLKMNNITAFFTHLTSGGSALEQTDVNISSLIDTWLLLRDIELNGERNRGLHVLKSRGMAHSNQIREFLITNHGVELREVYIGPSGVVTGSSRLALEVQEKAAKNLRLQEIEHKKIELERKRKMMELQISSMRTEFEALESETLKLILQEENREKQLEYEQLEMAKSRKADLSRPVKKGL